MNVAETTFPHITAASTPGLFERLLVELLVKMGYGGSQRDAAKAIGQSGDEEIDGIFEEDRVGLDTIYIQAKKCKHHHLLEDPRSRNLWVPCMVKGL